MLGVALAIPFGLPATMGWTALAAGLMGMALVQIGLIGHDAGHLAVFRSVRANRALGQFCWSVSLAISFFYWNDRHTRHHARTNDPGADPDIAGLGVIAYSPEQAATRRGWRRMIVRYQAFVGALLVVFLAFGFRIEGWIFTVRRLRGRRRWTEIALLVVGTALWLAPAAVLGWRWIAIYLASQVV